FGLEGPRRDALLDPGAPAGLVRDAPPRGRGGDEEGLEVVARDLAGSVPAQAGAQATWGEGRRHARELGRAHAGALEDEEGKATEQAGHGDPQRDEGGGEDVCTGQGRPAGLTAVLVRRPAVGRHRCDGDGGGRDEDDPTARALRAPPEVE